MAIRNQDNKNDAVYIFLNCKAYEGYSNLEYPKELDTVMQLWYDLGNKTGDRGCCVLGQGLFFEYEGVSYEMKPITGWQGEYSWVKWIDLIKTVLSSLGAINIEWHCGVLD